MSLVWSKYWEIADALSKAYPNQDLANINYAELSKLIIELPEFNDDPIVPGEEILDAVVNCWIDIEYPEEAEKIPSSEL